MMIHRGNGEVHYASIAERYKAPLVFVETYMSDKVMKFLAPYCMARIVRLKQLRTDAAKTTLTVFQFPSQSPFRPLGTKVASAEVKPRSSFHFCRGLCRRINHSQVRRHFAV